MPVLNILPDLNPKCFMETDLEKYKCLCDLRKEVRNRDTIGHGYKFLSLEIQTGFC